MLKPWLTLGLGVNINENMIRNLSLTIGDPADSAVKRPSAQQRSLDSLAEAVLSMEVSELWPTEPAVPGLTLLGKLRVT